MQITLDIPDDLAGALALSGQDRGRAALEALALNAYQEHRLTGFQVRTLLGFSSRFELDGFLKAHRVEKYSAEDFEHDLETIREAERRA
jgi:hypothetical protein